MVANHLAVAKWLSLISFLCQNSLTPIAFRYANTESSTEARYSTAESLIAMEGMKFVMSFLLFSVEQEFRVFRAAKLFVDEVATNPRDLLRVGVPSLLYYIQNCLLQYSSGHVPAGLWQVTYQGKVLVTAFFSVTLLNKVLLRAQWLAILLMALGIAIVQLSGAKETRQETMGNAHEQHMYIGFIQLFLACICSGFASVYFEKIIKAGGVKASQTKKLSVWMQNMQLSGCTLLLGSLVLAQERMNLENVEREFLQGFTPKVWAMLTNNAVGGLLVALVLKYADNLLRGFASALATIITSLIAVQAFGFTLGPSFLVGTFVVVASTLLYGNTISLPGSWWNTECLLFGVVQRRPYEVVPSDTKPETVGKPSVVEDSEKACGPG
jgi:UDP-galactose transporter